MSVIHVELIFVYGMRYASKFFFFFFAYGYLIVLAPFVETAVFFPYTHSHMHTYILTFHQVLQIINDTVIKTGSCKVTKIHYIYY